jgi:hypothetical protein
MERKVFCTMETTPSSDELEPSEAFAIIESIPALSRMKISS